MTEEIIHRLGKCLKRKLLYRKPLRITLNYKHQSDVEEYMRSSGLSLDFFKCIAGYRILGMVIINKGE